MHNATATIDRTVAIKWINTLATTVSLSIFNIRLHSEKRKASRVQRSAPESVNAGFEVSPATSKKASINSIITDDAQKVGTITCFLMNEKYFTKNSFASDQQFFSDNYSIFSVFFNRNFSKYTYCSKFFLNAVLCF